MDSIVVGSEDCAYNSVANILFLPGTYALVTEWWANLGRILDLSEREIRRLRTLILDEKAETYDLVYLVLKQWAERYESNATLHALCAKLDHLGWTECAENLRKRFETHGTMNGASYQGPPVLGFPSDYVRQPLDDDNEDPDVQQIVDTEVYYYTKNILGEGASSIVYEGYTNDPFYRKVAVKKMLKDQDEIYQRELEIWQSAHDKSPKETVNIVQLFHTKEDPIIGYFLVLELAKMDLMKRLESEPPRELVIDFLRGVASGLKWFHEENYVHRDIKPENILIFEYESGNKTVEIAKLADFGISRKYFANTNTLNKTNARGTEYWMAPEVTHAIRRGHDFQMKPSLDIFSLGMVFNYAINSVGPEKDIDIRCTELSEDEISANNLFQCMMQDEPKLRPTIRDVLQHPFFWDTDRSLKFLLDITNTSGKVADWDGLWGNITIAYRKYFENKHNHKFNWKEGVDPKLFSRMNKKGEWKDRSSDYSGESIRDLIKLVRDKYQHFKDLHPELEKETAFFVKVNDKLAFDENRYADYFLQKFSELVVILFCVLQQHKNETYMKEITLNYFLELNTFCWSDACTLKFFELFPC